MASCRTAYQIASRNARLDCGVNLPYMKQPTLLRLLCHCRTALQRRTLCCSRAESYHHSMSWMREPLTCDRSATNCDVKCNLRVHHVNEVLRGKSHLDNSNCGSQYTTTARHHPMAVNLIEKYLLKIASSSNDSNSPFYNEFSTQESNSTKYNISSHPTYLPRRHDNILWKGRSVPPPHSLLLVTNQRREHCRQFRSAASAAPTTSALQELPSSDDSQTEEKKKKPKLQKRTLKRMLSLATSEKWALTGGVALLGVSSAVTMSVPFIIGTLIDTIYTGGGSGSAALFSLIDSITSTATDATTGATAGATDAPATGDSAPAAAAVAEVAASASDMKLEKVCGALAGFFLVGGAANCGRIYLMTTAGQRISQRLRSRVFGSLLQQETGYFDSHPTGELVSRLAADTPLVAYALTNNVADGVRASVMATIGVAMMVYTSPELSLFGLSVVPPVALIGVYHGRKMRATAKAVQERLAACTQHASERLANVRTVRVFAQEGREVQRHDALLQSALQTMYTEARTRAHFFGLSGLCGNMLILAVLYKGSSLVTTGLLSVGNLSSFLMYAAYIGISVSGLASAYAELSKGAGAADRLFQLMDRQPLMALDGGTVLERVSGAVQFRDVHFHYPTRTHAPVFRGLSLAVPPGGVLAVVGASGCGKSSVLSLLLRLYDPQQGAVLLDGYDLTTLHPGTLRAAIGVVTQDPVLFSGSIRENLLYGAKDPDTVTEERVREAATQANAMDFIDNFPAGLDTLVGERGVLLSGGQRQRLAIARALITDPAILCLDEATSALDSESEHLVQEAVERLMRGRTTITIAHRLSTIRTADQIAVLQDGRVGELGSYEDLMARQDGLFKRLVSRQAVQH